MPCKKAMLGYGAAAGWSSQHHSNFPADAHAYARETESVQRLEQQEKAVSNSGRRQHV